MEKGRLFEEALVSTLLYRHARTHTHISQGGKRIQLH